jgi:hypothetical protein
MTRGATVIFDHFARFRQMGVRFLPPPQYFDKMEATATLENGTETQAEMTIASKRPKESEKAKMSREMHATTALMRHNQCERRIYDIHQALQDLGSYNLTTSKMTMTSCSASQQPPKSCMLTHTANISYSKLSQ